MRLVIFLLNLCNLLHLVYFLKCYNQRFFSNISNTTNLEYNKYDFKEKFLEAYSNSWALFLVYCGFILRIFVSKGDLSF